MARISIADAFYAGRYTEAQRDAALQAAQYCSYGWTDILNNKNHPRHSCNVNAYHRSAHICSCGTTR